MLNRLYLESLTLRAGLFVGALARGRSSLGERMTGAVAQPRASSSRADVTGRQR
jgi:hypothetical protein